MSNLLPANTVPEFYYFQRFCFDWHLVLYCHNEDSIFASQSEAAFPRREGQARDFLNRIQQRLGFRGKEMLFFAVTEFGSSGSGHLHILLSFDRLRKKDCLGKVAVASLQLPQIVEDVGKKMFPMSLKIKCKRVNPSPRSQTRVLSYVCKKEKGREFKHCFFSRWITRN
jgi:hypothetical protein